MLTVFILALYVCALGKTQIIMMPRLCYVQSPIKQKAGQANHCYFLSHKHHNEYKTKM